MSPCTLKPALCTNAVDIGPLAGQEIQQTLIDKGTPVSTSTTGRIKRVFKWGAQNELIPVEVWHRVQVAPVSQQG